MGSTAGSGSGRAAGNDPDGLPAGVRNAARLLWETARREAEEVQRGELESVRAELQAREDALAEAQAALVQREDAFAQARVSLDSALASSQQARETLELQLKEHAIEAHRVRIGLDEEIKRLTALLSQAGGTQERMRREHAETMAARDQDLRQAEERHAGQERRMLAEVDRASKPPRRWNPSWPGSSNGRPKARKRPRNGWRENSRSFTRFGKQRGTPRPGCASSWPP